jgi:hypothetical protein
VKQIDLLCDILPNPGGGLSLFGFLRLLRNPILFLGTQLHLVPVLGLKLLSLVLRLHRPQLVSVLQAFLLCHHVLTVDGFLYGDAAFLRPLLHRGPMLGFELLSLLTRLPGTQLISVLQALLLGHQLAAVDGIQILMKAIAVSITVLLPRLIRAMRLVPVLLHLVLPLHLLLPTLLCAPFLSSRPRARRGRQCESYDYRWD